MLNFHVFVVLNIVETLEGSHPAVFDGIEVKNTSMFNVREESCFKCQLGII